MTIAVAPSRPAARVSYGWRPRGEWDMCSLGWEILDWTHVNLPNPRDVTQPLVLTSEQARRVLRIYELDPRTGRRLWDSTFEEEAKGWGKGPLAAVLGLAEFGGAPVVFDGWDAEGQPVGKPWGSPGLPSPYAQVVAVSEAQTFNVWQQVMILASGARADLARVITVDSGRPGRTMLRRRDLPAALMERATASAASRSGAPVVHAVLDEVQLWTDENGGDELVRVVLFNLDKTGGWAHFLANAPVLGQGTVAEAWGKRGPRALFFATRPSERPESDWEPDRLRAALGEVYRDVPWIDIDRQLASLTLEAVPWNDALRFKFNVRVESDLAEAWMPPDLWGSRAGDPVLSLSEPTFVCVRVGHQHRAAAVAVTQCQADRVVLRMWTTEAPEGEYVDAASVEAHITEQRSYKAKVVSEVVRRPGGRPAKRMRPGPLLLHHEAFFEPSRQRLEREGMATMGVPSSAERLAPAAETLMQAVTSGSLIHDGDPETARQMARVVAKQRPKGWAIESGTGEPIVAVEAAALAVQWAMAAEVKRGTGRAF